ncbi:MAG: MBL fold metallo-hydrolase [Bacteroidales bacterium]|nr:MBL fold metallo-hydrolase [Bacteroidales bacterium]
MVSVKTFIFNPFEERCSVLWDEASEAVIVDPGCYDKAETARLTDFISAKKLHPSAIWLTHAHHDHIFGVKTLSELYGIPVYMSPIDKPTLELSGALASRFGLMEPLSDFPTEDIADGDEVCVGKVPFKVIGTPGHTPGGVCYYSESEKLLLSGDTLFRGSIGRSDLPGGDYDHLIVSVMDKLMGLPGDTEVIPGHGNNTDISTERTHNPFLQPWGNPDEDFV